MAARFFRLICRTFALLGLGGGLLTVGVSIGRAADPRATLVEALTNADLTAQIKIVQQLSIVADPIVSQVLGAWRQGSVYLYDGPDQSKVPFLLDSASDAAGKARAVAIATGKPLLDAAGKPLFLATAGLTAADTTSKLRKAIKTTLDVLALANPNPNLRRDAAAKLGFDQNPEFLLAFRARLAEEKEPGVRKALEEAIAITLLADGKPEVQLDAVRKLGAMKSIPALDLLEKLLTELSADPQRRGSALGIATLASVTQIHDHIVWGDFIGTCFRGLSLSAVLLVAALGLAITFGLMGIINMAHGEMIMVGAYTAYVSQSIFNRCFGAATGGADWYFVAALPGSFLTAGLLGLLLERGIIRFLYRRPLESLLATWGVSLILQQVFRATFGAANVDVSSPSWLRGNLTVADVGFTYGRIFVLGFAVAIVFLTWLILTKTSLGLQVRAVMQNRAMASCIGVRTDRVNMATFAFGSGLAGMAGACLSQLGNVGPSLGQSHIVDCFMVVVLGGVGNLAGTVGAALGIGVTDEILQPYLGAVLGKITVLSAIILFLQWRPAGLFVTRSRSL